MLTLVVIIILLLAAVVSTVAGVIARPGGHLSIGRRRHEAAAGSV